MFNSGLIIHLSNIPRHTYSYYKYITYHTYYTKHMQENYTYKKN